MKDQEDCRRATRARRHDDGFDYARDSRRRHQDNKVGQLCREVQHTIWLSLSGECHDEVLSELCVHSVVPAPDAGRLLVRVYFANPRAVVPLVELLQRLAAATPWIRREVARAIVRKRAPELAFQLISAEMASQGEEVDDDYAQ